jgi:protein-S-isoprenylcysteine O-methyltransferase Ste14
MPSALIGWVMSVNPYAEQSVRIQSERGHTVITSGPYRIVCHPMYLGAILMYLAMPLVWGSLWTLLLGTFVGVMMIWRTSREDQVLRQELPGYEGFTKRTRYRLLPGVW